MNNKKGIFRDLHTITNFKYHGNILWNGTLDPNKKFKMDDYLNYLKTLEICNEFNEKMNMDFEFYYNYKILGVCLLHNNTKLITIETDEHIHLITDQNFKTLYVTIGKCHPVFWYRFTSKKAFIDNFDAIYETYNSEVNIKNNNSLTVGFIGNETILSLNIHDLENHLLLNKYSDKLIWGSQWADHPFRNEYTKKTLTYTESIIYTGQAMMQENNKYTVSVKSKYSKSIITIHDYADAFIITIQYNPIHTPQNKSVNEIFERTYDIDLPIDVIMILITFPFVNHNDILNINPFTNFNLYILSLLVENNSELTDESLFKLNDICKTDIDHELKDEIIKYIEQTNDYKTLEKIMKDDYLFGLLNDMGKPNEQKVSVIIDNLLEKHNCKDNEFIQKKIESYIISCIDSI